MKPPKIYLGLLAVSASFLCNLAFAGDVESGMISEELSSGKIEATEVFASSNLAEELSQKINKKLNQDSTNSLSLVIMIADKVAAIKTKINENPDAAFVTLTTLDQALTNINDMDLREQEMGSTDSQIDSSNKTYMNLEKQISKIEIQK